MRPTFTIRKARKADGPTVFQLIWSARNDIPLKDQFNSDLTREWLTEECRRRRVWVVEAEGVIVGALHIFFDELFYLVVSDKQRRQGIARQLLAKGKRRRRWCRVAKANHAVIALLESEGFVYNPDRLTAGDWLAYIYRGH
jgi:N-acetylglutamate synthase-like GNAT family acetyltransferase